MNPEIFYQESYMKSKVKIRNEYGIHARPSALITKFATKYSDNDIFIFNLDNGSGPINCKEIMQVMTLEAPLGSTIEIQVSAMDKEDKTARNACRELTDLIYEGFGEKIVE